MAFFNRFGEWQDIKLLVSLWTRNKPGRSLLSSSRSQSELSALVNTILKIGNGRLSEILAIRMDPELLSEVIRVCKVSEFLTLPDDVILKLVSAGNADVRKMIALKAALAWPKKRAIAFVRTYEEESISHYYNARFWLDLPTSFSRKVTQVAARRVLDFNISVRN